MKLWKTGLLLLAVVVVSCQLGAPDTDLVLETPQQRGSYAQGVGLGREGQGLRLDHEAFVQGIRDGLSGDIRFTDDEMREAVMDFSNMMSESRGAEAEENRRAGEAFLEQNRQREDIQVTESGLQYEVIEEGDGKRPTATDVVRVHYRGTTISGDVFDESYARGEPSTFPLNRVIRGWTEGLQLMAEGSKYKLCVPGDLAYGPNPPPGSSFGPNATLIFEVELLEIVQQ